MTAHPIADTGRLRILPDHKLGRGTGGVGLKIVSKPRDLDLLGYRICKVNIKEPIRRKVGVDGNVRQTAFLIALNVGDRQVRCRNGYRVVGVKDFE